MQKPVMARITMRAPTTMPILAPRLRPPVEEPVVPEVSELSGLVMFTVVLLKTVPSRYVLRVCWPATGWESQAAWRAIASVESQYLRRAGDVRSHSC